MKQIANNETEKFYRAIEELNQERQKEVYDLLCSKEFQIGKMVTDCLSNIQKLRKKTVRDIISYRKYSVNRKKIEKKYSAGRDRDNKCDFNSSYSSQNSKIAVYTCVTGCYDRVKEPLLEFDNTDYFIFTDHKLNCLAEDIKKYEVQLVPEEILKMGNITANRYVKLHPFEFFHGYDYSIYLDGNIRAVSDIRKFVNKCTTQTGIAMHRHSERNCIYDEAAVCKAMNFGNPQYISRQMRKYKKEGFPEGYGMHEANVIVTDLSNPTAKILFDSWWNEFIRANSLRDQLCWPYVLWKNGYTIEDIGNLGTNVYKNYMLEYRKHNKKSLPELFLRNIR